MILISVAIFYSGIYALIGRLVGVSGIAGGFALMVPAFILLGLVYVKVFRIMESGLSQRPETSVSQP